MAASASALGIPPSRSIQRGRHARPSLTPDCRASALRIALRIPSGGTVAMAGCTDLTCRSTLARRAGFESLGLDERSVPCATAWCRLARSARIPTSFATRPHARLPMLVAAAGDEAACRSNRARWGNIASVAGRRRCRSRCRRCRRRRGQRHPPDPCASSTGLPAVGSCGQRAHPPWRPRGRQVPQKVRAAQNLQVVMAAVDAQARPRNGPRQRWSDGRPAAEHGGSACRGRLDHGCPAYSARRDRAHRRALDG